MTVRLFGIPVTIGPSIVVVLAILGFGVGDLVELALWVGIGIVSIVLHELGHALVARAGGGEPEIELAGLGGVTRHIPTERTSRRGWRLAISLAGPGVGFAIGAGALAIGATVELDGYAASALQILVFTSIGWSIFNLLPVLPLDGGQALRELLPGTAQERLERAAWVGVTVGALAVLAGILLDRLFLALFAGMLTAQNVRIATSRRNSEREQGQLRELFDAEDWRGLREALAAGRGGTALARAAQVRAGAAGAFQEAAEIGEVALERGATDPEFALRSAAAWRELGLDQRAARLEARAAELRDG